MRPGLRDWLRIALATSELNFGSVSFRAGAALASGSCIMDCLVENLLSIAEFRRVGVVA
jgi:hypothetical protein